MIIQYLKKGHLTSIPLEHLKKGASILDDNILQNLIMQISQKDLDLYHNEMQDLVEEFNKRDLIWPLLRLAFTFPSRYLRLLLDKFLAQLAKKG